MIFSGKGVILNYIKYQESSIIVKIFGDQHGFQSYLVSNVRSKKTKNSVGNFQPLSLVEITAYHSTQKELQRLSSCKIVQLQEVQPDFRKSTVIMFLTEVLSKLLIHETERNDLLFNFLWGSVLKLQKMGTRYECFHIKFLLQLSSIIGIDLRSEFSVLSHGDQELYQFLDNLKLDNYDDWSASTQIVRSKALNVIIDRISEEYGGISKINSMSVLQQVFS